MRQEFAEYPRVDLTSEGQLPVSIHQEASIGHSIDKTIEDHVGWPRVERHNAVPRSAARHIGHVADAAEIHDQSSTARMFQKQGMGYRCEWRSLSSCRNVTGTKVRNGRNPGPLGNHRRFGNLERGANGSNAGRLNPVRKMMDRLSMRTDQVHIGGA